MFAITAAATLLLVGLGAESVAGLVVESVAGFLVAAPRLQCRAHCFGIHQFLFTASFCSLPYGMRHCSSRRRLYSQ